MWFKDDPVLSTIPLAPAAAIAVPRDPLPRLLAKTYNRIGGLMAALADKADIPLEAALAVWQAESGGRTYSPGRPVLRFENHHFFKHWGRGNPALFDQHFQFGGRASVPGESWKNHRWRQSATQAWERFHGNQASEYAVFAFAQSLAGDEPACASCSFGGPQILGSNHGKVGYATAHALFTAMGADERWEVCSFFDFCNSSRILDEAREEAWEDFAEVYNGRGNAKEYGRLIESYFGAALALRLPAGAPVAQQPARAPLAPMAAAPNGGLDGAFGDGVVGSADGIVAPADDPNYLTDFVAFVNSLGLRHFKPYELLTMGHQHTNPRSDAFGLNDLPPRALWGNIKDTIQVLDELRVLLGASIAISSAYRAPAYNKAIGGARRSLHMEFNAIDFSVRSVSSPGDWAAALKQLRANGRFSGGIGVYPTFVHLDTRGTDETF